MAKAIKNEYDPDIVSAPGETLVETIQALDMSQAELSIRTDRPRKTISEIAKGKAAITADTALQFEKVLGAPASFWLNREMHYRESLARQSESAMLGKQIGWLESMPVADMCRLGWICRFDNPVAQVKELLVFFGVASPAAWHDLWRSTQLSFGRSATFGACPPATFAWLRKGELTARAAECETYSAHAFSAAMRKVKALTLGSVEEFQQRIPSICAPTGVAVTFVPELIGQRIHCAARWLTSRRAIIHLGQSYASIDTLQAAFFHAAEHILRRGKKAAVIEVEYHQSIFDEQKIEHAHAALQTGLKTC